MFKRLAAKYGFEFPECSKVIVWTIGLLLAFALTIKELVPLYIEYTENNVATLVSVSLRDTNFTPPQMVLYIPRRKVEGDHEDLHFLVDKLYNYYNGENLTDCAMCRKLESVSWDIWNQDTNLSQYAQDRKIFYNAVVLAYVRKLFVNSSIDQNVLDGEYVEWNSVVSSSALAYFHWLGSSDYYIKPANQIPRMGTIQDEIYQEKLGLIFSRTLTALCGRISYSEADYANEFDDPIMTTRTCTDLLLGFDAPVELDEMGLWFPLKILDKPSIKQYRLGFSNRETTEYGQRFTWKLHTTSPNEILLYPGVDALYASTIDSGSSSYIFQTPVADTGSSQIITARYGVQMRARETRFANSASCSRASTVTRCLMECTKVWLFEKCQCASLFYRIGTTYEGDLPYCTDALYEKCNVTKLPDEIRESCTKKCKDSCEYVSYIWEMSHNSYELDDGNTSELILRALPMFDTFVEITMAIKITPEQFFSQLTGVLNFYLGISGLSLFIFICQCIDWYRQYKASKAKMEQPSPDHISSISYRRDMAAKIRLEEMVYGGVMEKEEEWVMKLKKDLKKEMKQEMERTLNVRLRSRKGWLA